MITVDEAFHRIDEAMRARCKVGNLGDIQFQDFNEVGIDEWYMDYYYAEDGLYIIHDRITDAMTFVHGKSPKDAYEGYLEITRIMTEEGTFN